MSEIPKTNLGFKDFKHWHPYHKLGTVMAPISLGLGVTNFVYSRRQNDMDQHRVDVEQKSLAALQKIHKALVSKPPGT